VNDRSANEHRVVRWFPDNRQIDRGLEAINLPTKRISPYSDVKNAEDGLVCTPANHSFGKDNCPGARSVDRESVHGTLANRLEKVKLHEQFANRRTLATRDDQTIDITEIPDQANLETIDSDVPEHLDVLAIIALEG
jgi:hypothetical protein